MLLRVVLCVKSLLGKTKVLHYSFSGLLKPTFERVTRSLCVWALWAQVEFCRILRVDSRTDSAFLTLPFISLNLAVISTELIDLCSFCVNLLSILMLS